MGGRVDRGQCDVATPDGVVRADTTFVVPHDPMKAVCTGDCGPGVEVEAGDGDGDGDGEGAHRAVSRRPCPVRRSWRRMVTSGQSGTLTGE